MTAAVTLSCLLSDPQGGPDAAEIDEADRVLRAALAAEFRRGGVAAQWRILSALADVAAARGQDNAAVLLGKAAATVIRLGGPTTESGLGPRNLGRLAPLQRLAGRLVDATRYPQASEVKRIYQQEAAYDLLRRDSSLDPRTAEVSLTHEERSLIDELDRIRTSLIAFQHNADAASANDIALKEAELAGWLDRVVKEEWASSCAAPPPKRAHCVPERCVYVDFLSGSAGWTVYARTARAEAEHVIACPPRQLARAIFAFREAVAETRDDWRAHAQALYDLILRPIAQSLAGNTRISFSLSGPFASLPFAALHDGKMHLIERFALSVRTGIRVQERAEPHEEGCTVLLFGPRPTERDDGAQLDTELGSIAALYDDARWATSFTAAGLVEGFRLRPRIAHIASHFRFEAGRPGHSWFALENGERLTMSRFREPAFDLGSLELLVLAMCDSALPDSGDAVLDSMAAVAQCRGAHCVLGTLWPVADRSAALLMTDFHTRLRDARDLTVLSVADALHGAQAAMAAPDCGDLVRSFWAHPYHWAGFVLFEPDP